MEAHAAAGEAAAESAEQAVEAQAAGREALLEVVAAAGRENSTATVLFHTGIAAALGLNPTDYKALDILIREGPLTAGEIGAATGLATASVTGLIDRLEKRGLARRVHDTRDRRRVIVEPDLDEVERGMYLFESFNEALGGLLKTYSDDELRLIADFLARSAAVIREETVRLAETQRSRR